MSKKSRVEPKETKKKSSPYREPPSTRDADAPDDVEVRVGGVLAWALPLGTIVAATGVAVFASAGPALLVLLGGAILGAVLLLWGSIRTLTGDAALTPALASAAIRERVTDAQERKRRVLRALKDLEQEHDVGKLDAEDFERLSDQYRAEAKAILREIDGEIEPRRAKAEAIVRAHLEKQGRRPEPEPEPEPVEEEEEEESADEDQDEDENPETRACPSCGAENDLDADFCKKCGAKMAAEAKDEVET